MQRGLSTPSTSTARTPLRKGVRTQAARTVLRQRLHFCNLFISESTFIFNYFFCVRKKKYIYINTSLVDLVLHDAIRVAFPRRFERDGERKRY